MLLLRKIGEGEDEPPPTALARGAGERIGDDGREDEEEAADLLEEGGVGFDDDMDCY